MPGRRGRRCPDRRRADLARRSLNGYLEHTGDYEGLAVLRFYQVYRALVRAKVACIRLSQSGLGNYEKRKAREEYLGYARLAELYMQTSHSALIVTHGLSGSGKTWLSQQLLENLGAIRLRSDVERKRLHRLPAYARSGSDIDSGIYTPEASQRTYARLAELAQAVLRSGYPVIVDATFLRRSQRNLLHSVAEQLRTPFVIIDLQAPESTLRERVQHRTRQEQEVSEAGLAVLNHQLVTREPLSADEQRAVLPFVSGASPDIALLLRQLRERIGAT